MNRIAEIVREILFLPFEEEWFELKENRFDPNSIGAYISALSNGAASKGKEFGYLIWGVHNDTHEIVGTEINFHREINGEPFEHFLARKVTPDTNFVFHEITVNEKRLVVLEIPRAKVIPTAFDGVRYIRIGSSKVNLAKYPERESALFDLLRHGQPTIETVPTEYEDLTFDRLFTYYAGKGISLSDTNFRKNLGLLTKDGQYNLLAQLLSDNSHIPVRVSIFSGETKSSTLISVKEFGNTCLLLSLDKVLEYGDVINLIQADERDRRMFRKEVPLFDPDAYREAVINAFVHNKWISGNAPMITVYRDRLEILSRGTLAPEQTLEGFYLGESVPVNQKLADIFLQLHISERSGRGVPKIMERYGKEAFEFRANSIVVTLPFKWIDRPVSESTLKSQTSQVSNRKPGKLLSSRKTSPKKF